MFCGDIYPLVRSDEFSLSLGQEASVDLTLEKSILPCTKLYGKVFSGGRAISEACVKVFDSDFKPLYHTLTGKDGRFSFINTIMPGEYELLASADAFLVSKSRRISLPADEPLFIDIYLKKDKNAALGTVYGVIRDESNKPLPETKVYIYKCDNASHPESLAISNLDGEYVFCGLEPGKYLIGAAHDGYKLPERVEVHLYPKTFARADLYLYFDSSAILGTVSGKVTFAGYSAANALTFLYLTEGNDEKLVRTGNTNDEGVYLFGGLKPGNYVVKAKLESESTVYCGEYSL